MLHNPNGAYISKKDPHKVNVFVYADGRLYVVLATMGEEETLTDFSARQA